MPHDHKYTFVEPDGRKVDGYRHKNPDGSIGGWVAQNAKISDTAIVESGAVVEPKATIRPGSRVPSGKIVRYQSVFP